MCLTFHWSFDKSCSVDTPSTAINLRATHFPMYRRGPFFPTHTNIQSYLFGCIFKNTHKQREGNKKTNVRVIVFQVFLSTNLTMHSSCSCPTPIDTIRMMSDNLKMNLRKKEKNVYFYSHIAAFICHLTVEMFSER